VSGGGEGAPAAVVPVAPSRECVGCGFDVVGLGLHAMCPECELPVRKTCGRWMLREDVGRGRRFVWSAWFVSAGVVLPVVLIGFMIFAEFFGSLWPWVRDLQHAVDGDVLGVSFFWLVSAILATSVLLLSSAACAPWWMRAGAVLAAVLPTVWVSMTQMDLFFQSQLGWVILFAGPALFAAAIVHLLMTLSWSLRSVAGACDRYSAMASTKWLYLGSKLWCGFGVVPVFGAILLLNIDFDNQTPLVSFVERSLELFSLMVFLPATVAVVVYAIVNWVRVLRAVRREMEFGCYAELK